MQDDTARSLPVAIGQKIRDRRRKLGMNMETFAKAAGLSKAHVSSLERGRSDTHLSTLEAVARALGVPIVYLFRSRRERNFVPAHILRQLQEAKDSRDIALLTELTKLIALLVLVPKRQ